VFLFLDVVNARVEQVFAATKTIICLLHILVARESTLDAPEEEAWTVIGLLAMTHLVVEDTNVKAAH